VVGAALTEVHFGKKDLRRVNERTARTDVEDEDRMVTASRMARLGRRRGRGAPFVEA
jgi:hypothetical protein